MNTKQIMIVAGPESRLNQLPVWAGLSRTFMITIADSDEHAIEMAHSKLFDMVVMEEDEDSVDLKKLSAILPILQADMEIVEYNGESFEKLNDQIRAHFAAKKNDRIMRFLVLDSSGTYGSWNDLPAFSAN